MYRQFTAPRILAATLLLGAALATLPGCSSRIPGQWEYRCDTSPLVPDGDRCHVGLEVDDRLLALSPEGDRWLLGVAWTGADYQLIQAVIDVPKLRRSVRQEDGFCAGPACWIELSQTEVARLAARGSLRVELTRVFRTEEGGTRRGTVAFHAPTRGLQEAFGQLKAQPTPGAS